LKRILLFCSAGMSTSLLVTKMQKAAQVKGLEIAIDAFPEAEMASHIDEADIVLLGPQIRFALGRAKKLCDEKSIPLEVINSIDYGMMDGEKVLEKALKLIENKNGGVKNE